MLRPLFDRVAEWREVRRSDTNIISYPKSGRTWVRVMLGKVLVDHYEMQLEKPADMLNLEKFRQYDRRAPSMNVTHDGKPSYKTIPELHRDKSRFSRCGVILLARDPRDVVISGWHRRSKAGIKGHREEFTGTISEYIRHEVYGVEKVAEFLNIWARNRDVPKAFLLVRYEDMISDSAKELRRMLDFIGVPDVEDATVHAAVEYGSFDSMRSLEETDELASGRLRPVDASNPDTFKVRKGAPGGYRDDLSPEDIAYVDALVAEKLDPYYGY